MKKKNKKIVFVPGLSEKPDYYDWMPDNIQVVDIDWNKPTYNFGKVDIITGFSMGAILACTHALKHKVGYIIACSMTTGVGSLAGLKADGIHFIIGSNEKWAIEDTKRLIKTLEIPWRLTIVPEEGHKIKGEYRKLLLKEIEAAQKVA